MYILTVDAGVTPVVRLVMELLQPNVVLRCMLDCQSTTLSMLSCSSILIGYNLSCTIE